MQQRASPNYLSKTWRLSYPQWEATLARRQPKALEDTHLEDTHAFDLPPKLSAASDRVSFTYMRRGLGDMNMKRGLVLSLAAFALAASAVGQGTAATVTLALDLYYGDSNGDHIPDAAAAGTWQLVALTTTGDNRGIAGVDTALTGVVNATGATGASFRAPTGAATVGGVAGQAGFQTVYDAKSWAQDQDASATTLDMLFGQVPVGTPNQGLFYDVGNPAAGNIKGSGDAGAGQPAITGLGSTVTWNLDDTLGDWLADGNANNSNGAFQRGVLMAFGRFSAGSAPAFAAGGTAANVFTVLGTAAAAPATGTIQSATIATSVRNNTTVRSADFTLDNRVDAADIGALLGGFDGGVADRLWQQGDATGDKRVDAADVGQVLAHFTGDPGPTPAGTAKAEYNPATGAIKVSVNGVLSWYVESLTGGLTGSAATLPAVGGALNTDNDARVGQSSFGSQLNYQDHNLGNVAAVGLPAGNLIIRSSAAFGAPEIEGIVTFVPEPATFALVGFAGLALVAARRRAA